VKLPRSTPARNASERLHRRLMARAPFLSLHTACYLALCGWSSWPERWQAVCVVRQMHGKRWPDELLESQLSVCAMEGGIA